ncbi:MAG: hypothetical protein Q7R72_00235 [bacterium]|nr:hypothetical protein [bacterium]
MILSRFYKKAVLCLIIVSLLIPSGLLFYPKKVSAAGADCISQIAATLGLSKVVKALTGKSVPVENKTIETGATGSFVKDCIIEPLVTQLAKAMLYNITVSTIEWINSGFQGNPGFVQDFRGLMTNTADSVIGEFLEKEAAFLCQPFAFQVRVQLAETYLPYRQRAACTLSQAANNVSGFANNNNGIGWENWIEVTTVPQNNQYGALVIAQDEVSKRIFDAQYVIKTRLDWGNGFKDYEVCEDELDADGHPTGNKDCTPTTPGAIVEAQLSKTLGIGLDQLAVADNINAILDALANQFTKQIVNGTVGLLGGRKAPNVKQTAGFGWGSVNYDQAIKANNNDQALSNAIDDSLEQTNTELAPYFTEPEPIEVDDAPEENTTDTITPDEQSLDWSVTNPNSTVTAGNPLSYTVDLTSNYSASNLNVTMTLKRQGVATPFRNVLTSPRVGYGRDGNLAFQNITSETDATEKWLKVSVNQNSRFTFKLMGNKKDGISGSYIIEMTVSDAENNVLKKESSSFIVQ